VITAGRTGGITDGILVELIVLNDRPCLRVTKIVNGRHYHIDYCRSIPPSTWPTSAR
jgi:hypothetical protein